MSASNLQTTHVAVAVIKNNAGQVLLALRPDHVHQGGLWEFPGGKLESGEVFEQALKREIFEEIGIEIISAEPLIRVRHDYADKSVLLDVWSVLEYKHEPYSKEGQKIEWININELSVENMPAADLPIITAIRLPEYCLITPDAKGDDPVFLQGLKCSLESGVKLIQFRSNNLSAPKYIELAKKVISLSREYNAQVMLNQSFDVFQCCQADGLHLNSKRLMGADKRPVSADVLLSASCHNQAEVKQAGKIGVDFIMLSPVLATKSHPGASALGWESFYDLTESACMPVYALGGMKQEHIAKAKKQGAQGIAAIRSLWKG